MQDVYWYLSEEELGDIKDYSGIIRIPNIVADEESNGDNEFIVNEISEDAFLNSSVTSVEILENVKNIKPLTFTSCGTLQSITVSEDNNYYSNGEDGALYNKTMTELIQIPGGLTNFEIMACVEDINNKALCSCKNLKNITIEEGNETFEVDNSVLYKKNNEGDKINILFVAKDITDIVIPEGITSIDENIFTGCSLLKSIYLPTSLTDILESAFANCI